MLDEREFLSPYGIRAISQIHREQPYVLRADGWSIEWITSPAILDRTLRRQFQLAGPIWFPVNFLLIESLQKFHHYLGDDFKVECPTGSGQMMTLWEVAAEISRRMTRIFLKGPDGSRPVHGANRLYHDDPNWKDLVLFYEYFHGDNGVRCRRQPPDRLDRRGGQAAATERRTRDSQTELRSRSRPRNLRLCRVTN